MVKVSPKISLMETISRNKGRKYLSKLLQSQKSGSNVKYKSQDIFHSKNSEDSLCFIFSQKSHQTFFFPIPAAKKKKTS